MEVKCSNCFLILRLEAEYIGYLFVIGPLISAFKNKSTFCTCSKNVMIINIINFIYLTSNGLIYYDQSLLSNKLFYYKRDIRDNL